MSFDLYHLSHCRFSSSSSLLMGSNTVPGDEVKKVSVKSQGLIIESNALMYNCH